MKTKVRKFLGQIATFVDVTGVDGREAFLSPVLNRVTKNQILKATIITRHNKVCITIYVLELCPVKQNIFPKISNIISHGKIQGMPITSCKKPFYH